MTGTVFLVGSGPGDPELLTVKARRLIDEADVVLHDALPGPEIIETIPEDRREDVGKRAGGERTPQEEINERLVEHARAGRDVVRLKGGDPFLFGRGGEELEHLAAAGIAVEVVPGVSSAIGAPGVAGIPATHREHASSLSIVTGHEDPTKDESAVDWAALAATGGTLVVLMGVGRLGEYTAALLDAGMAPETPIALVERGSWPDQQVAVGSLETAAATRDDAGIEPPAVTVIGAVAGTRERVVAQLANEVTPGAEADTAADAGGAGAGGDAGAAEAGDADRGPMSDATGDAGDGDRATEADRPRVAVFRPDDGRLAAAADRLRALGAEPVPDAMLAVEPTGALPAAGDGGGPVEQGAEADYVVFTSTTGAALVADAGWSPGEATVCAIGASTAAALREAGYAVEVVPEEFSSTGLVEALVDRPDVAGGATVEVARSDHGSDVLLDGLRAGGAAVHETVLYRLVRPGGAGAAAVPAAVAGELDAAAFTSTLTVEHLLAAADERGERDAVLAALDRAVVGAIGAPTRETLAGHGLSVGVVPDRADVDELLADVVAAVGHPDS